MHKFIFIPQKYFWINMQWWNLLKLESWVLSERYSTPPMLFQTACIRRCSIWNAIWRLSASAFNDVYFRTFVTYSSHVWKLKKPVFKWLQASNKQQKTQKLLNVPGWPAACRKTHSMWQTSTLCMFDFQISQDMGWKRST